MTKVFDELFKATALPALFLGHSSNALKAWIASPTLVQIGKISFVMLCAVTIGRLLLHLSGRLVPRRFANLLYVLDDEMNLALIEHPHHKRIQPPGSRRGYHEAPHAAASRVLKEELGLQADQFVLWPQVEKTIGKVEIVPPPIQVQIERRKQRLGVKEHYDFVYLCRVPGCRPALSSPINPRWLSLTELKKAAKDDVERAPFEDVIPTVEKIMSDLRSADGVI